MMNEEYKERWLTAFRSGKYKQGRRVLRGSKDHYCCLGVLCDVANPEGWEKDDTNAWCNEGVDYLPSDKVIDMTGFNHSHDFIRYNGEPHEIFVLNDTYKLSFDEIADLIEEQL